MIHLLPLVGINVDLTGAALQVQFLTYAALGIFLWVFTLISIIALVEIYEKITSYSKSAIITRSAEL
ncbi:hypothetical protein J2755_002020 [Methanohalophilus levihalophilus]|uniref:hypothetical protein n=1 Tax=Methanohalophilus levihalophilus TaxID=1431282 RepID=UPI001AE9554C|nr:hypothetical protein [Methanohalophilus levihalophilus]MBP2031072.1 hypothetical protein [Methanohalophilus levihalophilus]